MFKALHGNVGDPPAHYAGHCANAVETDVPICCANSQAREHAFGAASSQQAVAEHVASTDVFQRSLFGLVRVYNLLPQSVVDAATIHIFQRH